MANGQMLCILAPIPQDHAQAVRQALALGAPLRGALDQALHAAGIFHFACIAVLPGPGLKEGGQDDPRLMIELAVDPHLGVAEATQALARCALPELWQLAAPAMPAPVPPTPHLETLAQWLASRATIAACGFVGTPERTVRQIHAEAALLADARQRARQTLAQDHLRTSAELAASVCTLVDQGSIHDFARQPAARNFWQRAPLCIRLLGAAIKLVLPAVLIAVVLLGLLAFFGLGAVVAGSVVLGFEPVVRVALGVQPGAALWAMGVVFAGAMVLWISTALYRQALLSATVVAILLTGAGVLAPSLLLAFPAAGQALLALAGWGAAAAFGVALLAALLAATLALAVALAPPFLGWRGLAIWAVVLFVPYVAASHFVLQLALDAGAAGFGLEPLQTLRGALPVWGWLPAADLVGTILLALSLMGVVVVMSGFRFGRTLPEQLLRRLDRPRAARPLGTALRTHVSIEANEAELRGQTNHMISVTDLRRIGPFGIVPAALTLRVMLWGISILSTTVFTKGLLGRAAGIHFGHWRLIDGGRRLLFSSNFEGSLGGYLDEFIAGASQGVNLIWRWTELRPRQAAMPDQPGQMPQPGVAQAGQWPPTRLGFLLGCRYEQRFKAYARASQVPHLYRFAAYARSNHDIVRATRLRNALRAKLLAERAGARALVADDQIMRALES
ncbi:MAG: hypothetical protein ACOYLV_01400 [Rubrivivax sp.]